MEWHHIYTLVDYLKKKALGILTAIISMLIFSLSLVPSYGNTNYEDYTLEINNIDRGSWWWADIELLSEDMTDNSVNVDMDIDFEDNIHVCWRDDTNYDSCGSDRDIFYRKWTKATKTWSTIEVVSTESTADGNDPAIAVDPSGNVHIVWIDITALDEPGVDSDIFYKMKDVSTGLWSTTEIASSSSIDYSFQPDVAVDSSGNAYVVWFDHHNFDGTDTDIIFNKRDFTSETWTSITVVSSESTDDSGTPKIVLDGNNFIHIVWEDYTSGIYGSGPDRDICYKKWDPVNEWSSGLAVSYESTDVSYMPFIETDSTNTIHVTWTDSTDYEGCGTDNDIFYRKWEPSTSTWTPLTVVSTVSGDASSASVLTVDNYRNVHFIWSDQENYGGAGIDTDAFYCYLDSDSETLSTTTVISASSIGNSYPRNIHTDSMNYVHTVWYDYSNDLLGSGADPDIFYKKFVGPPTVPNLASFVPNTRTIGNLAIEWSPSKGADEYSIYRSNSYIWDVEELSPLATSANNTFVDELNETGIYYYGIVASSDFGDSDISNIESVEIIESEPSGLFADFNWGEIIIIAGIVGGLQIILTIIMAVLFRPSQPPTKKKK
jgi:hypothetical protein